MEILNPNCSEVVFRLYTGDKKQDSLPDEDENVDTIDVSTESGLIDSYKYAVRAFTRIKRKNKKLKGVSWSFMESTTDYLDSDDADYVLQLAFEAVKNSKKRSSNLKAVKELEKNLFSEENEEEEEE